MTAANDLTDLIGRTPVLNLKRLFPDSKAILLAELKLCNPMSIKDRAVLSMIHPALKEGHITANTEVVEASKGNTAIAIVSLGALFRFRVKIYMSELTSTGVRFSALMERKS